MTLGANGRWLGTRTRFGSAVTLASCLFGRSLWFLKLVKCSTYINCCYNNYSLCILPPSLPLSVEHEQTFEMQYLIGTVHCYNRIFRPRTDENGEWRRLHNEQLHSLYRSSNIIRVIKSRRLRWAGHMARMEVRSSFTIYQINL